MEKEPFDLENLPSETEDIPKPKDAVDREDKEDPMTPERERRIDFNWENDPTILNARQTMREMPDSIAEDLLPDHIKRKLSEIQKRKLIEKREKENKEG